jgi:hypothetical protein
VDGLRKVRSRDKEGACIFSYGSQRGKGGDRLREGRNTVIKSSDTPSETVDLLRCSNRDSLTKVDVREALSNHD